MYLVGLDLDVRNFLFQEPGEIVVASSRITPKCARGNTELLPKRMTEMRRVAESPPKRDLRDGLCALAKIQHVFAAGFQSPDSDIVTHRVSGYGKDPV